MANIWFFVRPFCVAATGNAMSPPQLDMFFLKYWEGEDIITTSLQNEEPLPSTIVLETVVLSS